MEKSFIYWFLMLLWAIFYGIGYSSPAPRRWGVWGSGIILFLLFIVIGLKLFGEPIRG